MVSSESNFKLFFFVHNKGINGHWAYHKAAIEWVRVQKPQIIIFFFITSFLSHLTVYLITILITVKLFSFGRSRFFFFLIQLRPPSSPLFCRSPHLAPSITGCMRFQLVRRMLIGLSWSIFIDKMPVFPVLFSFNRLL